MLANLQVLLVMLFYVAILIACAWALIDLLTRPTAAFVQAGKLTKAKWGAILGVSTVVAFIAVPLPQQYLLVAQFPSFLALLAAVAGIVYLVDVRPAITPYSRRRGPRGGGSGSRGGW